MAAMAGVGPKQTGVWRGESKVANDFILRVPYLAMLVMGRREEATKRLSDEATKG